MVVHHHDGNCTSVSPACPVIDTTYGYYPLLGPNAFLSALFFVCLIAQLILGTLKKTWTFMLAVGLGILGEGLGYIGRIQMHKNPWSRSGFELQICCLVLAPSFLAAGIYLTLKHFVNHYGPELSRLKPNRYPWLFIGCDLGSILLQAAGGGLAASAGNKVPTNTAMLNAGDDIIIAGIAFQVVTMFIFGLLATDFFFKFQRKQRKSLAEKQEGAEKDKYNTRLRIFTFAMAFAFLTIWIRCIYR